MLTVLCVIGTRPEAIKMAPVVKELARFPERVRSVVCVTGQHREMLDSVLRVFDITADYDLAVMQPDQALARLTADLITGLDAVVERTRPDWILAQGDTTTVLAAALVSYYHRIPFGHVEAGLRTGNRYAPFPEEMNRYLADGVAEAMFAPTAAGRQRLLAEGRLDERIVVTGNTVIDALIDVAARPYDWATGPLAAVPRERQLVLVTAHRREIFGEGLQGIVGSVRELAAKFGGRGVHFVWPVHLNPNVRGPVLGILGGVPNVTLLEPLDYVSLVHLMSRATLILTDSGGIQEEAPSLRVPVLVMRDTTERPEGVDAGVVRLVGTDSRRIVEEADRLLSEPDTRAAMATGVNPYGDGKAAGRIVAFLLGLPESTDREGR